MSDRDFLKKLLPSTTETEQKYLHYIFDNPFQAYLINEEYFLDLNHTFIIKTIKKILDNKLTFTLDELKRYIVRVEPDYNISYLTSIVSQQYVNPDDLKKEMKENYTRYTITDKLENVLYITTNQGRVPFDELIKSVNELSNSIHGDSSVMHNGNELSDSHKKTMEKRKEGIAKKSLGYKELDKLITKPGAPEEMTAMVGMKGGGKSALKQNIELKNIARGIPVISFNLEMSEESIMDRFVCMMEGLPLIEVLNCHTNARLESRVNRCIEVIKNWNNYLLYTDPSLTLDQLDGYIHQAKNIFREKGIDSSYVFVTIDNADMIEEFSIAKSPYEIKKAVNRTHQIFKGHKSHGLLLLQANENKLRTGKIFKKSDDLDYYKIGMEDIEGSAAFGARCRAVISLTRPVQMKKRFFPEQMERWNLEIDAMHCNIVKQNEGPEGFTKFILNDNFRVYALERDAEAQSEE